MMELIRRLLLSLSGGIPLLSVSVVLVMIWINPASIASGEWLRLGASMILIEFLLLHSGAFMAVGPTLWKQTWQQLSWFGGMCLFYGLFFVAIVFWAGQADVIWLLGGVMLSRLLVLIIIRDKRGTLMLLYRSAFGILLLMLCLLVTLIPLPKLGITPTIAMEAFGHADDSMARLPERFLAAGAAYFLLMGLGELWVGWRIVDWKDEDVEESWRALRK